MIVSLQDNQGGAAVQIKATHDQIPTLLHEIASRIIDWRMESLTIRPEEMDRQVLTLHPRSYGLVAVNEAGELIATRKTYCNPAALSQLILDVEMVGAVIDWPNSTIAKPEK